MPAGMGGAPTQLEQLQQKLDLERTFVLSEQTSLDSKLTLKLHLTGGGDEVQVHSADGDNTHLDEHIFSQMGSGMDAVDDEASQPLSGGEEAVGSQPLPTEDDGPSVRFLCEYGTTHGADATFELQVRHGAKVYLGRPGATATAGLQRATLTTSAAHGISRENGWIQYDQHRGVVLVPLQRPGFPVFHGERLLSHDEPPVVLSDGDIIGFGGNHGSRLSPTTVRYRCRQLNMPNLLPLPVMPPPPPRPPQPEEGKGGEQGADSGADTSAAAGDKRERGETSRQAKKRRKAAAPAAAQAASDTAASGLSAQAQQAQHHAALVAPLNSEQRRWARRALDCTADCYGVIQTAVAEVTTAEGGSAGLLHAAIARALHKVQALAGDSSQEQKRARGAARTEVAQHSARGHAAQQRHDGGRGGGCGGHGNGRGGHVVRGRAPGGKRRGGGSSRR
jgi:hypothetical protein